MVMKILLKAVLMQFNFILSSSVRFLPIPFFLINFRSFTILEVCFSVRDLGNIVPKVWFNTCSLMSECYSYSIGR